MLVEVLHRMKPVFQRKGNDSSSLPGPLETKLKKKKRVLFFIQSPQGTMGPLILAARLFSFLFWSGPTIFENDNFFS